VALLAVVLAAVPLTTVQGHIEPANTPDTTRPAAPSGFATRSGDHLLLSGEANQFTGVDAYELGTDPLIGWWPPLPVTTII
jgi:hypothetical protein